MLDGVLCEVDVNTCEVEVVASAVEFGLNLGLVRLNMVGE